MMKLFNSDAFQSIFKYAMKILKMLLKGSTVELMLSLDTFCSFKQYKSFAHGQRGEIEDNSCQRTTVFK